MNMDKKNSFLFRGIPVFTAMVQNFSLGKNLILLEVIRVPKCRLKIYPGGAGGPQFALDY